MTDPGLYGLPGVGALVVSAVALLGLGPRGLRAASRTPDEPSPGCLWH